MGKYTVVLFEYNNSKIHQKLIVCKEEICFLDKNKEALSFMHFY